MTQTTNKKKKKGEVSNSNGSYIPDDIHFSILSKLPVKSIKRFSCVRKSWSLLFENPIFVDMFVSKSDSLYHDASLILNQYPNSFFYFLSSHKFQNKLKLNFPPPFNTPELDTIDILGSVNGILCVIGYIRNIGTSTILLNPATEEVKVLPISRGELLSEITTELVFHGFGYDHVRNDFKVIQYVDVVEGKDPFWEIYSLKTDSWRKICIDMPVRCGVYANRDVYLNGVCHWLGQTEGNDEKFNMVMVSFHLGNEVCFVTPLPFLEDMEYGFEDVKLQVFNGSVAVIFNRIETKSFHISILGEIGVEESWVRLFDIGPLSCIMDPIIVWKKGNILVRKEDDQLACFDLTTGMIEEIGVKAEQFCQMVVYKKSKLPFGVIDLCCPCRNAGQRDQPNNWRGAGAGCVAGAISVVRALINLILDTILFKKKY